MLSSAATSSIAAKTLTPVSTSTGTRVELRCPQPLRQVQWHPPQKVGGRELRGVTGYCPQLLCDVLADVDDPADCELFCGGCHWTWRSGCGQRSSTRVPVDVETGVNVLAAMLLVAALLSMLAWRINLPYAVALVLGGIVFEQVHLVDLPQLEPRILLFVFLPPLLFDAAFRLDDVQLRRSARPVLWLAIPGTVATAVIVGLMLVAV